MDRMVWVRSDKLTDQSMAYSTCLSLDGDDHDIEFVMADERSAHDLAAALRCHEKTIVDVWVREKGRRL